MEKMIMIDIDIINAEEAKTNYKQPQKYYTLQEGTQIIIERIKNQIEIDSKWTNEIYGKIPYMVAKVDNMIEMIKSIVESYGYHISIIKKRNYATYKIEF